MSKATSAFGAQSRLLEKCKAPIIFDCGANVGQTTAKYLKLFPRATIYAFEPNPVVYEKLQQVHGKNPRVVLRQMAVGSKVGTLPLNVGNHPGTSSLLDKDMRYGKGWHFTKTVDVAVNTIDTACAVHKIRHLHLLKMDLQGYELEALKGAGVLLAQKRISVIYCEVLHLELYKGAPLHADITKHLAQYGYRMVQLFHAAKSHGDAIYVPR